MIPRALSRSVLLSIMLLAPAGLQAQGVAPPAPFEIGFGQILDVAATSATKVAEGTSGHDLYLIEGTASYGGGRHGTPNTSVIVNIGSFTTTLIPGQDRWSMLVAVKNFRGLPAVRAFQSGIGASFQGNARVGDLDPLGTTAEGAYDSSVVGGGSVYGVPSN